MTLIKTNMIKRVVIKNDIFDTYMFHL